jgi:valacyclovir hydrolase
LKISGTIWSDFKPQIEGFNHEKFQVVVWDPPGYGKSRPPDKQFDVNFYHTDADYAREMMKVWYIVKIKINIMKFNLTFLDFRL